MFLLGKALGGGVMPVSAIAARRELMDVFTPGSHGSTFGGNPLACAVGSAVIGLLETGEFQTRARELGQRLAGGLRGLPSEHVREVRTVGLWAGVELHEPIARAVCHALLERGVLAKDTHATTVRLAPPLMITADEVDLLVTTMREAIAEVTAASPATV